VDDIIPSRLLQDFFVLGLSAQDSPHRFILRFYAISQQCATQKFDLVKSDFALTGGHTKRRRNDGTADGTAQSVISPMGRHRASAIPWSVRRTKTSTLYFIYPYDIFPVQLETCVPSHTHRKQVFRSSWMAWTSAHAVPSLPISLSTRRDRQRDACPSP